MGVKVREKVKGSGEWWIFVNHQGKRKSKKVGNRRTANQVAKEIEKSIIKGDFDLNLDVPTLKEYIYGWGDDNGNHEGWFDKVARLSLKNSTRYGYDKIIKIHLVPEFGSKPLDQITSRLVDDFIFSLFRKGLKSGTVRNVKNCLSAILRHADKTGYIKSNPARGIEIPIPEDEKPGRVPCPFTWEERAHFETIVKEKFSRHYPVVLCGFRAGLRIGELIGLKWGDIDFFNRIIFVQHNVTRGKITTPKSKAGTRQVRMTTQLHDVLTALRGRMKEEKIKKGWAVVPEWVFCNENGGYLNYGNFVNRFWKKAIEKSGLSARTPHDMRHTYATLRLSKGDSLSEVSKEMGHSNPNITYRSYYKWLPKESRSNIDELDGMETDTTRTLSAPEK